MSLYISWFIRIFFDFRVYIFRNLLYGFVKVLIVAEFLFLENMLTFFI